MPLNCYLNMGDIKGSSLVYPRWIELVSFSWGESRTGARPGVNISDTSKPSFQSLKAYKLADRASPMLMKTCARETHIPEIVLRVDAAGGPTPLLAYALRLQGCQLSAFRTSFQDNVVEELNITFDVIAVESVERGADGLVTKVVCIEYNLIGDTSKTVTPEFIAP